MTTANSAGAQQTLPEDLPEPHTGNGQSSWSGPANVHSLLQEREKTHGDFRRVAGVAGDLKSIIHGAGTNWGKLRRDKQEALDMIASKMGRILSGDPECKDHWRDISGYAELIAESLDD